MTYGRYELDAQRQPCFRPPVPDFPPLEKIWSDYEAAKRAVTEFDRRLSQFPEHNLVGKLFARLDAVHSSGAEGATTTFTDLMEFQTELARAPDPADAKSVRACAEAFDGLAHHPITPKDAILAIHRRLFETAPDPHLAAGAGKFKSVRNGTFDRDAGGFFYYTAPDSVPAALDQWQTFTEAHGQAPEMIRQALSHWMFEHIHPVTDGNGRVGRLLVPLMLRSKGDSTVACGFLGEAVHANKDLYIDALKDGRRTGDLAPYVRVFLSLVRQTAEANLDRMDKLQGVLRAWSAELAALRSDATARKVAHWALTTPIFTVNDAVRQLGRAASWQTVNTAVDKLLELGILRQIGDRQRSRLFEAAAIMGIFDTIGRKDEAANLEETSR